MIIYKPTVHCGGIKYIANPIDLHIVALRINRIESRVYNEKAISQKLYGKVMYMYFFFVIFFASLPYSNKPQVDGLLVKMVKGR